MELSDVLRDLSKVLAYIYNTEIKARTIADASGVWTGLVPFSGASENDWFAILKQADLQNRMDRLLETAGDGYSEYAPLIEARQAWTRFQALETQRRYVKKLFDLVTEARLDEATWQELLNACRPDRLGRSPAQFANLHDSLAEIWDWQVQSPGWLPVLVFAEQLRRRLENSHADLALRVYEWMEEAAKLRNVPLAAARRPQARTETKAAGLSLLIVLEQDDDNIDAHPEKGFQLRLYLWSNRRREWLSEQSVSLSQDIGDKIYAQVTELGRAGIQTNELVLEFFLPFRLLSEPVHTWGKLKLDKPLGYFHPVLVRPLNRAQNLGDNSYWAWKQRWDSFKHALNGQAAGADWVRVYPKHIDFDDLFADLVANKSLSCLGFGYSPTYPDARSRTLEAMMEGGVPVALWPRHQQLDAAAQVSQACEIICAMLEPAQLARLPSEVQIRRIRMSSSPDDLILFWDDFDRLPGDWQMDAQDLAAPITGV